MVEDRRRRVDPRASLPSPTRAGAGRGAGRRDDVPRGGEAWQCDFPAATGSSWKERRSRLRSGALRSPAFGTTAQPSGRTGMKALALVDAPDHVCCRYRIRAFGPALDEAGWSLTIRGLAPGAWRRWSQLARGD